jgi:hypothetical protein
MPSGGEPTEPTDPNAPDPWAAIEFNDDFIAGARRSEASADERVERAKRVNAEHAALEREGAISRYASTRKLRFNWFRRNQSWLIPVSVLVALGVALALAPMIGRWIGAEMNPPGWPPTGQGEHSTRVHAAAMAADALPYNFQHTQVDSDKPVTYDPCRVIHYVINPVGAPAGGDALVRNAFKTLTEATGLQFIYQGTSGERFTPTRPAYQPRRYGLRWSPVLVIWSQPKQDPLLHGDVIGDAGSAWVSVGDGSRYFVTGTVSLDGPQLGELLQQKDGARLVRSVVLHELGHLAGLSHVNDPTQLMYPHTSDAVSGYQKGDLAGLARLGKGQCSKAF